MWILLAGMTAMAGTLPKGAHNVYSGGSYGTWSSFESKGTEKSLPQDAVVTQILSKTHYTYGIHERFDLSITIPVLSVSVSALSGNLFETTTGLGQTGIGSNIGLFQQNNLSVTGTVGLYTGVFHAESRGRLTNIGDGSTQLRGGVAVSQLWDVNSGYLNINAKGGYIFKIPSTLDFDPKYPADDITYGLSVGGGYKGYSASVFVDGFQRLNGVDYPATSVDSIEGFTALKASQLKVGRSDSLTINEWTLSGYVASSVLATNNPMDELIGGIGIGYFIQP
jgi:hypothetical protein